MSPPSETFPEHLIQSSSPSLPCPFHSILHTQHSAFVYLVSVSHHEGEKSRLCVFSLRADLPGPRGVPAIPGHVHGCRIQDMTLGSARSHLPGHCASLRDVGATKAVFPAQALPLPLHVPTLLSTRPSSLQPLSPSLFQKPESQC